MMRTALMLLVSSLPAVALAQVSFTSPPTATTVGGKVEIAFTVSEATDVEVAVLDATGKIIRHLAAGVVGKPEAAPPLKPNSLTQRLIWNRTDDAGKQIDGKTSVRVRAGMTAKFSRIIGASPYRGILTSQPYRGSVQGLAVDARGTLYVKMMSAVRSHGNSGLWPWQLRRFTPEGEYVKTLLPYPPSTDPAKTTGWQLINTGDGRLTPVQQNSLYPVLSILGSAIHHRVTAAGEVVWIDSRRRELHFFKIDGSNEIRTIQMWPKSAKLKSPGWLNFEIAFSPQGRYVYYSNAAGTVYDGKKPEDIDPKWPNGRVYRHDLKNPETAPEPFFTLTLPDWNEKKYWMPSAWDKRTAAAGIDVDPQGNVYVGDLVNQEIVVINPAGKLIETIQAHWPDRVQVHPKTGDLYVVSRKVSRGFRPPDKLLKIVRKDGKAEIVATLPMKTRGNLEICLDPRGKTPILWAVGPGGLPGGEAVFKIEDRGDELVIVKNIFDRDADALGFAGNIRVDAEADLVYITDTRGTMFRYDGATGKGGRIKVAASDLAIGPGGGIFRIRGWNSTIGRYTRDLKPDPIVEKKTHEFGYFYGRAGRGCSVGGLHVDSAGRIFVLQEGGGMFVKAYEPDGSLVDSPMKRTAKPEGEIPVLIDGFDIRAGGLRTDREGNIYVGWGHVPPKFKPPSAWAKDMAYRRCTGSVLKFSAKGGRRVKVPRGQKPPPGTVMGFTGVLRVYPDLGAFSSWRCDGSCVCAKPRFDLDAFGRLYIPNATTFSVTVLDNAGNRIVRFGHYGNFDAAGPDSAEPKPELPLGWPQGVGVAGDHVYVADVLNHRILRAEMTYAAEAVCPVQ